jgi:hypothetical protein
LDLVSSATYTLAPTKGVVHVSVAVTATNNKPNLVQKTPNGTRTTRYFYERARLVIQREATKVKASAGGASLSVTPHDAANYKIIDVGFRSDLFFHQKATFRLEFDLPGGAPRSAGDIRVGSAFATFYAWAFGDRGDVRIVVPAEFTVTTTGSTLERSVGAGATTLTAVGVTDVTDWYAVMVADRHDALTRERIDLTGGEHIVIRAWPEDAEWRTRVGDLLRKGLPTLVDLVGLDWPVSGDIEVAEVHTPLLEGYAGVFHVGEDRIEISEDLDELTIIHEASHAWFNSGLFVGRWIDEGFADEYASLVLDKVSSGGFDPDPIKPDDAGHVRLNEWVHPGRIADTETDLREQFGYDASWTVVRALVAEIGVERMRDVLAAAADRRIPYAGAGAPERLNGAADWRRFLDLLEETGGSVGATELFDRWVVLAADEPLLATRTEARTAYDALVAAGAGWMPGIAVRQPLADWDFAAARTRIEAALAILKTRDQIAALARDLGATPPTVLRGAYEGAADLAPVGAMADAVLASLEGLQRTKATASAQGDLVSAVGLWGADPAAELAAGLAAFGAGDTVAASAAASRTDALLAAAPELGRTRLLAGAGIVVGGGLIAGGSVAFYRRRRLDRRPLGQASRLRLGATTPVMQAHLVEPADVPDVLPLAQPPSQTPGEPASVAAYRHRRLERGPLPPTGDSTTPETSSSIVVPRRFPRPASAVDSPSAPTPTSAAAPKPAAPPTSAAKLTSATTRKRTAKPKSGASPTVPGAPDATDPYATLGAPPADEAEQEPAAPPGEEEHRT